MRKGVIAIALMVLVAVCLATMAVAAARGPRGGGSGSGGNGEGSGSGGGHAMIEIEGAKVMLNGYDGYKYRIHLENDNFNQWFPEDNCDDINIKKGNTFWVVFGAGASLHGRTSGDIYTDVPGSAEEPKDYTVTVNVLLDCQVEPIDSLTGTLTVGSAEEH